MARKYARIFIRGHYLFREANSFPRAKLEENCELRGTGNVQGQISEHVFAAKLRLLCLLSIGFKNWGISSGIPQFWLGNIRPRDAFRPITREQNYLMDYNITIEFMFAGINMFFINSRIHFISVDRTFN